MDEYGEGGGSVTGHTKKWAGDGAGGPRSFSPHDTTAAFRSPRGKVFTYWGRCSRWR